MNIWTRPPWKFRPPSAALSRYGLQVYGVPAEIVAIYPAFAGAEFLKVGDDVAILERVSRRIVAMLSRTSGAYVAERMAPRRPRSTMGVAPPQDRVRLSRAQIAASALSCGNASVVTVACRFLRRQCGAGHRTPLRISRSA